MAKKSNLTKLDQKNEILSQHQGSVRKLIDAIVDPQSFVETDAFFGKSDVEDSKGEGVVTGFAYIGDKPVCIAAQNATVLGGALGKAHADKILRAIRRAVDNGFDFVSLIDSAGAKIDDGLDALDGYAEILAEMSVLRCSATHFAVVTGNAVGLMGVFAASSDFLFLNETAALAATSPYVVAAKAGLEKPAYELLGDEAHAANGKAVEFGYSDLSEVREAILSINAFISDEPVDTDDDPNRIEPALNDNLSADALLEAVADDRYYLELFARFAPQTVTALASVNGIPVAVIVDNADENHPKLNGQSMRKIKNFVRIADQYGLPLVHFVDCEGLDACLKCEQKGLAVKAAKLVDALAQYSAPRIAVASGAATGFGYTAFCSKALGVDYVFAFPEATVGILPARTAVAAFMKEEMLASALDPEQARATLEASYQKHAANPFEAAKSGKIDNIIEPAHIRPHLASILKLASEGGAL